MSSATDVSPTGTETGGAAGRRRPSRRTLLVVGLVLLVLIVGGLVPRGEGRRPLDPESVSSTGAGALARVLERHGTPVLPARTPEELRAAGTARTIVVVDHGDIGATSLTALRDRLAAGRSTDRLVLLDPSNDTLTALDVPLERGGSEAPLQAECHTDLADPQDTVLGASLYRTTGSASPTPCYVGEDGEAALFEVPAGDRRPTTIVFGGGQDLDNAHITRASHAALALRMLNRGAPVLWYVPPAGEDAADPSVPTAADARLPQWLVPALVILASTTLMFLLLRGRRFGPLVTEPLPVVVPAGETTRARARMYRRSGDEAGVSALLARAAATDIRDHLRLPPDASMEQIASAVERATGEPAVEVAAMLDPARRSSTTASLTDHHRHLRFLTRKVRRS